MPQSTHADTCFTILRDHTRLRARHRRSEERLKEIRAEFQGSQACLGDALSIFCTGSFARREAGEHSDLDLFIVADQRPKRLHEIRILAEVIRINDSLKFPPFSNDGQYLDVHLFEDLKKATGSRYDDSRNLFTTRLLLMLESEPIFEDATYAKYLQGVADHYYRDDDPAKSFKPLFLLNDLLRYWRTLCLNYEEGRNDPEREFRKRNANLKFSRLVTVFSTVLPLVAEPLDTLDKFVALCRRPALRRLAQGVDRLDDAGLVERWEGFLDDYADFLELKDSGISENSKEVQESTLTNGAMRVSEFLYDALTHENILADYRRYLVL